MTAFSVAVTLASSRNSVVPRRRSARISYVCPVSISAPSAASAWMCVSIRRRPMTSPPGGGTVAVPNRASSGPASRMDARIWLQSSSSSSVVVRPDASTRTSLGPVQSASAPVPRMSASIVSTSRIRGTFPSSTGSPASSVAARIGSAAFLFPAACTLPESECPPSMTRYTKAEPLLRHALAVEASVGWYARHFAEDEERWRVVALLHDFDYEIHPTLDKHPQDGAPILRDEGYPEDVVEAVLSHAEHLALPRDTALKRTLFACDELSGFVHACGLVRPTGLDGLEPKSVRKKLKQPSFAAGVHRDEVYAGAGLIGLELDEHIANVVGALQPIARELGLRTATDAA